MRTFRLLAVAAISTLLAACNNANPASSIAPAPQAPASSDEFRTISTFTAQNVDTGDYVRIFPTIDTIASDRVMLGHNVTTSSNLTYHGGPVQVTPHIYVVYWGSSWNSTTGDPKGLRSYYNAFLGVIGGSKWLNTVTQYTQSNGQHVGNSAGSFVGSYVDTSSSPPSKPTQSQLASEAAKAAAHYNDYSANASFIVALPHGIKPSGFGTQYCAWHSSASVSGKGTIGYTNLPYMPDAGYSCGVGSVNNPGTLDGVSIVGGHEQGETETDPQPNSGWLDGSGSEIGDKCAWVSLENNPNAGNYPTQPLWSNATSSCVQSY